MAAVRTQLPQPPQTWKTNLRHGGSQITLPVLRTSNNNVQTTPTIRQSPYRRRLI